MSRVTVGVARLWTLTAQWPWVLSVCQNLQPFNGNGESPYEWKFFEWDKKSKQTNKQKTYRTITITHQTALVIEFGDIKIYHNPLLRNLQYFNLWDNVQTYLNFFTGRRKHLKLRIFGETQVKVSSQVMQWNTVMF